MYRVMSVVRPLIESQRIPVREGHGRRQVEGTEDERMGLSSCMTQRNPPLGDSIRSADPRPSWRWYHLSLHSKRSPRSRSPPRERYTQTLCGHTHLSYYNIFYCHYIVPFVLFLLDSLYLPIDQKNYSPVLFDFA